MLIFHSAGCRYEEKLSLYLIQPDRCHELECQTLSLLYVSPGSEFDISHQQYHPQVMISAPVQLFICWRIKIISGSKIIAAFIIFFAVCSFSRDLKFIEKRPPYSCIFSWRHCHYHIGQPYLRICQIAGVRWCCNYLVGIFCGGRRHHYFQPRLVSCKLISQQPYSGYKLILLSLPQRQRKTGHTHTDDVINRIIRCKVFSQ